MYPRPTQGVFFDILPDCQLAEIFLLLEQMYDIKKQGVGCFGVFGLWFQSYKIEQFASGLTNESMVNDYLGMKTLQETKHF